MDSPLASCTRVLARIRGVLCERVAFDCFRCDGALRLDHGGYCKRHLRASRSSGHGLTSATGLGCAPGNQACGTQRQNILHIECFRPIEINRAHPRNWLCCGEDAIVHIAQLPDAISVPQPVQLQSRRTRVPGPTAAARRMAVALMRSKERRRTIPTMAFW